MKQLNMNQKKKSWISPNSNGNVSLLVYYEILYKADE